MFSYWKVFFIIFADVSLLKGQQRVEELQHIFFKFYFPSFYNNYNKFCCKLYPGGCYRLLDSAGFTCDELKGRVTKREGNGWIEFQISDVHMANSGFYRCGILGAQNQIYSDYFVEVLGEYSYPECYVLFITCIVGKNSEVWSCVQKFQLTARLKHQRSKLPEAPQESQTSLLL